MNRLGHIRRFMHEARVLELDVLLPEVDYSPLDEADMAWGTEDHIPDLQTRRAMKKRGEDWTSKYK